MKVTLYDNYFKTDEELIKEFEDVFNKEDFKDENAYLQHLREERSFNEEIDYTDLMNQLNIKGNFVIVAELGLWNGKIRTTKLIDNLNNFLNTELDYVKIHTDENDLLLKGSHHDGTNYYLMREIKDDMTDRQIDNFRHKINQGDISKNTLDYYTKSVKNLVLENLGFL